VATRRSSRFIDKVRSGELQSTEGMHASELERGGDFIQSLERGLAAIRAFTGDRSALSVTEVAERSGVSRAAARRILFTLRRLGYVGTTENGLYRLEPTVLTLGYAYISSQDLIGLARPYMESAANELGGSCSLGVLHGTDVMFIARVRAPGYLGTTLSVGSLLPAHLTAMGRVLLADLPDEEIDAYLRDVRPEAFTQFTVTGRAELRKAIMRTRESGYSVIDQELVVGVHALGVPIHDQHGKVQAGLNVAVVDSRASERRMLKVHLPALRRAADAITAALRATG
jgi:IclR family pca regulon transcriptional regulator